MSNRIPDQKDILEICAALCSVNSSSVFDVSELVLQLYGERSNDITQLDSFFIDLLVRATGEMQDLGALKAACFGETSRFNGPLQLLAVILTKSTAFLERVRVRDKSIIDAILSFLREWRSLVKRTPGSDLSFPLVPKAVDSCLLSLASAFESHYKPLSVQKPRTDKAPVGDDALTVSPIEIAASRICELLPPVDQSVADNMAEAATVALDVLRYSIQYVESSPHPQSGKDDLENSYLPCPRSSTEAALELLKTVCKHRKSAELVLSEQGHQVILHLPASLSSQPVDHLISAILRHLVEEPSVLQAAMEASIRSTMTRKGGIFSYSSGKDQHIPLRQFMASFSSLACRNPEVFISAMKSICTFKKEGKKILISLSKPQEEKNNEQAGVTPPGNPSSSKCAQKISPAKRQSKKIASCILNVVDALIGRMLCLVRCMKLLMDTGSKNASETRKKIINQLGVSEEKESSSESYILSQQVLCLSTMTELLQSFSGCVSAFLRRDADPMKSWMIEDVDTWLQAFSSNNSKKDKFIKRSKGKEKEASTNIGLESESVCFLIAQIIGNQISHKFALPVSLKENVSRQACYMLSTVSQRSLEGQKRVIQQITRILTSWSHGRSSSQPLKGFRNVDNAIKKEVTTDVEGALTLLSFLILSQWRTEDIIKQQNCLIDAFLDSGIIKVLADILPNIQLNGTGMERNVIQATVLIRSLEKLTSVCLRKQQSITDPGDGSELNQFMTHLNESRCELRVEIHG